MGKTFEEWWEETAYAVIDYAELNIDYDPPINFETIKKQQKLSGKNLGTT